MSTKEAKPQKEARPQRAPVGRGPRPKKPKKQRPKWVDALAAVGALALAVWVGFHLISFFSDRPHELDPGVAQPALAKLRQEPSTVSGVTVDEYLTRELEKSRRVGNLRKYQGWTIAPVRGSKTKLLIAFSYEEMDNSEHRAEWLADSSSNTFVPQTELAMAAYKK